MSVAVKPIISSGLALVGASVIAVAPVTPVAAPAPDARIVDSDVNLTASSVAYVPINMIEQTLSAPANMVAAMDRLATALTISGSWNENHPNNQWGWDEANPAMLMEMVNTMVPFPAFSEPWGRHLNWWAAANLPMHDGCNYDCPDPAGLFAKMFRVPMSEFYDDGGYTFPVVTTPFNGEPTPWSKQQVILDPAEPFVSVWNSLTEEPSGIKTTTWWDMVAAVANLGAALHITGHLPEWVAVRDIETFVKHFLEPPAQEQVPESDPDTVSPLSLVAATSVLEQDSPAELSAVADHDDEADKDSESDTVVSSSSAQPDLMTAVTNDLRKKFATAPADEVTEEVQDADDTVADDPGEMADQVKTDDDTVADDPDETADQVKTDDDTDEKADDTVDSAADDKGAEDTGGKHRKADDTQSEAGSEKSGASDSA